MEKEKKVKDVDFADSAVPASARKNVVTMFMIMLGFTFCSATSVQKPVCHLIFCPREPLAKKVPICRQP